MFENEFALVSSIYLVVGHQQVLLASFSKHSSQFAQVLCPCQPPSNALLNVNHLCPSLIKVDFNEVTRAIATVQALNQYAWTVSFKDSFQAVDIHL